MFEILIERNAEKDLRRLSDEVHDRVIRSIQTLQTDPRPAGAKKLVGSRRDWRLRVGDYRVLYEIADEIRIVRIFRIRHRREVYESLRAAGTRNPWSVGSTAQLAPLIQSRRNWAQLAPFTCLRRTLGSDGEIFLDFLNVRIPKESMTLKTTHRVGLHVRVNSTKSASLSMGVDA